MKHTGLVETKTASFTVTAADSGKTYLMDGTSASVVATLPATAAGLVYSFVTQVVPGAGGNAISPVAADSVNGGADNKDLINTYGTAAIGDSVTIVGDGDVGWYTTKKRGTWAEEA